IAIKAERIEWVGIVVQFWRFTHCGEGTLQVIRKRRPKIQRFSSHTMEEPEPGCMQEMTFLWQVGEPAPSASTIGIIAHDWMSDRCEMHTNLMRAPGMQMRP